jgi:hypothetical protein
MGNESKGGILENKGERYLGWKREFGMIWTVVPVLTDCVGPMDDGFQNEG